MSKIVIDARELRTTSGRYVERLLTYLTEIDRVHKYFLLISPRDINGWGVDNPNFNKIPCPYKEFTFSEQIGLKKLIEDLKPDLVHFTFPQQPAFYRGKTISAVLDLTTTRFNNPDKKYLVFKFKQQVYKWLIKRISRKSAEIIVPSNFVRQDVIKFTNINPDKVHVIYDAADKITDNAQPLNTVSGKQYIMYIGRPTPHKNLERLIEAHSLLLEKHPGLHLVLSGKEDSNYKRIHRQTEKDKRKNIIFTGFVSDAQLRWLYENCRAYVFPSLSEGFGLPGLEAMLQGAPVVSSNATCLPEIYGDAARYFDPLDVQDMSKAINEVLTDQNLRAELVSKGLKQVSKYSWEKMAKETLALYNKVLSENN